MKVYQQFNSTVPEKKRDPALNNHSQSYTTVQTHIKILIKIMHELGTFLTYGNRNDE